MSRADEERAKFCSKIALIRNNLLSEVGPVQQSSGVVYDVFTKINQVIEDNNQSDVDDDASSSASLLCAGDHDHEESKEAESDLSLSVIRKQIATGSEESSAALSEEVWKGNVQATDNFRQTNLKSYF